MVTRVIHRGSSDSKQSKKHESVIQLIKDCADFSAMYQEDHNRNWELYEGERQRLEDTQHRYDHLYRSHIGAKVVDQLSTFAVQALTNEGGKIFSVAPYNNVEVQRQARAATLLLNYYLSNTDPEEELFKTLFEAELFGTGILEVEYATQYIKQPKQEAQVKIARDDDGNLTAIKANEYELVPYLSQPRLRHVKLSDFWVDRRTTSIKDLEVACIRDIITWEEIKKCKKKYMLKNLDKAKASEFPQRRRVDYENTNKKGHRQRNAQYNTEELREYNRTEAGIKNPKMELIKVYRPGTVQFVLNDVVISEEQVLYTGVRFPFEIFRNNPVPSEFYGRSSLELIKNDIEYYEEMVSLIQDKHLLSLKPIFLADATTFMKSQLDEYKRAGAGDIIAVNGLNTDAIREVKAMPPDPSTVAFAESFKQDAKDAVSVTPMMDNAQGLSSGVRDANTFNMIANMGSTRLKNKVKIYAKAFENVGRIMLQIAKDYAKKPEYIEVTGALGDTEEQWIDPRTIDTRVKFKVKLGAIADPQHATKAAQQLAFIGQAVQLDPLGIFRHYKAMAEVAAEADMFEDPVSLYETDGEVIDAMATLKAELAGIERPVVSDLPTLSEAQSQQQGQAPGPETPGQPADQGQVPTGASVPQMTEGN
jgi:hypothetical protein